MWDAFLGTPETMFATLFLVAFVGGVVAVAVWMAHAIFHSIVNLVGKAGRTKFSWEGLLTAGLVMLALALLASFLRWALCEDHPGWRTAAMPAVRATTCPVQQSMVASEILPTLCPTTSEDSPFRPERNATVAFSLAGDEAQALWIDYPGKYSWTVRNGPDHYAIYKPGSRQPLSVSNAGSGLSRDLGHLGSKIGLKFPGPCTLIIQTQ